LAKKLAGETSDKENEVFERWFSHGPENRELFGKLKSDWKIMNKMNKQFDVDNAWNKLHVRISGQESFSGRGSGEIKGMPLRRIVLTPVRIAASLLLLAMLGVAGVFISGKFQKNTFSTVSVDRQRSIVLPDGSKVYLNANTRFSYPKEFGQTKREVTLSGEAFFEVSPDKSKPFIIHAEDADIRVIGTSFNIDTRKKEQEVEVYVATGVVELYESDNKSNHLVLRPGEVGTLHRNFIKAEKSKNENPIAWKTGKMDFQETRLSEAIEVLNKIYRVNIVCTDTGLNNQQTTGEYSYPQEPLDTILAVFCKQNYLKIEKSDNSIYLTR